MALCLLGLLLFLPPAVRPDDQRCSREQQVSSPNGRALDAFCIREASLRKASAVRVFQNGTCHFRLACTESASPPMFMRLRPDSRVLLLRTRVERNVNPAELLINGAANSTQEQEPPRNLLDSFKSPLLPLVDGVPVISRIYVQLVAEGRVIVNLKFAVTVTEVISKGAWFNRAQLEASNPWNIKDLMSSRYALFTVNGDRNKKFAIIEKDGICTESVGYMFLIHNFDECRVSGDATDDAWIYYTVMTKSPMKFRKENVRKADEMRVIGRINAHSKDIFYLRIK